MSELMSYREGSLEEIFHVKGFVQRSSTQRMHNLTQMMHKGHMQGQKNSVKESDRRHPYIHLSVPASANFNHEEFPCKFGTDSHCILCQR